MTWPDFCVTDKASGKIIQAPNALRINLLKAADLRNILLGTFFLKVRIEHSGTTYVMENNPTAPDLPPYQFPVNDAIDVD